MKLVSNQTIDFMNRLPRGANTIQKPTVVRMDGREWLLAKTASHGLQSQGFRYSSLRELFLDWDIVVVGCGRDSHSFFYEVKAK